MKEVRRNRTANKYIKNLSENLFYIMRQKNFTIKQMSIECDVSLRKMCEIIYREDKGLRLSTLESISDRIGIPISALIEKDLKQEKEFERKLNRF